MEKERTQKITGNTIKHQKDEVMIGDYNINLNHVQSHIYSIRNVDVMLDKELAILYGVETKVLNQAVKRNIRRFPERYMFQLSKEEWESLRSQIVTSKNGRGGDRYIPYVFTEQGITQLSTVLKSDTAIEVSIKIMDAFVAMRRFGQKFMRNNQIGDATRNDIINHQITLIIWKRTYSHWVTMNC
jgi:hypothetical protein